MSAARTEDAGLTAKPHPDGLLYESSEWDFATLSEAYNAIEEIALGDLALNVYPNQIEIISSEQMLDAYSSHGMPLMYNHWSFGKIFAREEMMYQKGLQGLAYEIVINANPCISFLMDENTMTMQTLVTAHAAFGHNHFFKNNYLFRQWTDAEAILDYLNFAKKYIAKCEEEFGTQAVEEILDSAHALMDQGVFRYARPPRPNEEEQMERMRARLNHHEATFNDLWRTLPNQEANEAESAEQAGDAVASALSLPEENVLYFLEKRSPTLKTWQREILRIVRNIAQYFYPQKQTKVMNEGCATFVHHYIMTELHAQGRLTDGAYMEFLHSHSSVVFQPEFDDPRYSGLNPYALGYAMMEDIRRISKYPTEEDRAWFPDLAGKQDWRSALKDAWANFRDESFILQFLSPKVIRDFRLFAIEDQENDPFYSVSGIHDEMGYRRVRAGLARSYDLGEIEPNIQVVAADIQGDRKLTLRHTRHQGVPLEEATKKEVLKHIRRLWGYEVVLHSE